MIRNKMVATSIDNYIADFPLNIQTILEQIRKAIRKAAPQAEEKISYCMPTFAQNGTLVHFAACKKHIGFYPAPSGITPFEKELSGYKSAKGSVQFPMNKPMPLDLIAEIVKFRVQENLEKAKKNKR